MPAISEIETNARGLAVKQTIKKRSDLWNRPGSCVHRRSIIYATSDGQEVTSEQNRLNTCVYDTLNETFVHLTKSDVNGFANPTGGAYNDHVRIVDNHIQVKIAAAPNCLTAKYYNKMMHDPNRTVILFNRASGSDEFHSVGRVQYIPESFLPIDYECLRKKVTKENKVPYFVPQPTMCLRLLDVTPSMLHIDPSILALPMGAAA